MTCKNCRKDETGMCDSCANEELKKLNAAPEINVKPSEVELLRAENLRLVDENVALKETMKDIASWGVPEQVYNEMNKLDIEVRYGMPDRDFFRLKADKCMQSIPATDAAIAEIESVGAEKMFNLVEPTQRFATSVIQ